MEGAYSIATRRDTSLADQLALNVHGRGLFMKKEEVPSVPVVHVAKMEAVV